MRPNKKDELVRKALTVFYRDGFHATGMDKLVAETGVSKTSMYKHFRTKEELIVAVLKLRDESFREWFERRVDELADRLFTYHFTLEYCRNRNILPAFALCQTYKHLEPSLLTHHALTHLVRIHLCNGRLIKYCTDPEERLSNYLIGRTKPGSRSKVKTIQQL